jgi:hypothetical protein
MASGLSERYLFAKVPVKIPTQCETGQTELRQHFPAASQALLLGQ